MSWMLSAVSTPAPKRVKLEPRVAARDVLGALGPASKTAKVLASLKPGGVGHGGGDGAGDGVGDSGGLEAKWGIGAGFWIEISELKMLLSRQWSFAVAKAMRGGVEVHIRL